MRQRQAEVRFDWRGGVQLTLGEDLLTRQEAIRLQNARTDTGAVVKRLGSRRVHTAALAGPVVGLHGGYDAPTGRQVVAIAGGTLYAKAITASSFTAVASGFATETRARMVTYRRGGNLYLYIAQNGFFEYNGTIVVPVSSAPPGVLDCEVYRGRMFVTNGTKTLYWSTLLDATKFSPADGGGFEDIETFDAEPLIALATVGGSLLLFKEDSIARFTGVDPTDIRVEKQTEGVAPDTGCVARGTVVQLPGAVFFLANEGPYLATESSVQPIGRQIEAVIAETDRAALADAWAVYHKGRQEVWLALPHNSATLNEIWVWSLRTQTWAGPWTLPATVLDRMERQNGEETVIRGGLDGWVREEDYAPALDDRALDGTGGQPVSIVVEVPLLFGDPSHEHSLVGRQSFQLDLGTAGVANVSWTSERGSGGTSIASLGSGLRSYSARLGARGHRIRLSISESSAEVTQIAGVILRAAVGAAAA
jgi:hypothetical protein